MALRRKVVKGVRIQGNQHTITSFKWKKQRQEVDEKQKKSVRQDEVSGRGVEEKSYETETNEITSNAENEGSVGGNEQRNDWKTESA